LSEERLSRVRRLSEPRDPCRGPRRQEGERDRWGWDAELVGLSHRGSDDPEFAHPVAALLTVHHPRSALVPTPGHHRAVSGCRVAREVALGERTPLVHRSVAEDVRTALHDVPSVHGDYLPLRAFRAAVAFGGRPGPPGRHVPRVLRRRRRRPFVVFGLVPETPPSSDWIAEPTSCCTMSRITVTKLFCLGIVPPFGYGTLPRHPAPNRVGSDSANAGQVQRIGAGAGCDRARDSARSAYKAPQKVLETVAGATGETGGVEGSERRLRFAMLPAGARWKRGRATRCEPAGRALWCARFHPLGLRAGEVGDAG